eukprot:1139763-Pelagomonas_calceolata.AAC.1
MMLSSTTCLVGNYSCFRHSWSCNAATAHKINAKYPWTHLTTWESRRSRGAAPKEGSDHEAHRKAARMRCTFSSALLSKTPATIPVLFVGGAAQGAALRGSATNATA